MTVGPFLVLLAFAFLVVGIVVWRRRGRTAGLLTIGGAVVLGGLGAFALNMASNAGVS